MTIIKNWWNKLSEGKKSTVCCVGGFALGFGIPALIWGVDKKED